MSEPQELPSFSDRELDDIAAQADETSPYYLPRLIAMAKRSLLYKRALEVMCKQLDAGRE